MEGFGGQTLQNKEMCKLEVKVLESGNALAEEAAFQFVKAAKYSLRTSGKFSVALAGGSTPLRLYDLLTMDPYCSGIDWTKVHFFWGDERCVSPDDADSNYHQADVHLLTKLDIPPQNIHRVPGEFGASQAADLYEQDLRKFFGRIPVFDLILLGMGPDGHTASLFPNSTALNETQRWVVGVPHSTPPPPLVDRVSLTLPVINTARKVIFMVAGSEKAPIMKQILDPDTKSELLPVQRVMPEIGKVTWLLEKSALGQPPHL
jgi:6-phosphogluconolactonase